MSNFLQKYFKLNFNIILLLHLKIIKSVIAVHFGIAESGRSINVKRCQLNIRETVKNQIYRALI